MGLGQAFQLWSIAVDDIAMGQRRYDPCTSRLGRCRISGLCRPRSLLSRQVFLRESLLPCLALPIIVSHSPPIDDHPAAKLSEHRLGRYNRDLSGAIGVWKDILLYQVIFLCLGGNNFVE